MLKLMTAALGVAIVGAMLHWGQPAPKQDRRISETVLERGRDTAFPAAPAERLRTAEEVAAILAEIKAEPEPEGPMRRDATLADTEAEQSPPRTPEIEIAVLPEEPARPAAPAAPVELAEPWEDPEGAPVADGDFALAALDEATVEIPHAVAISRLPVPRPRAVVRSVAEPAAPAPAPIAERVDEPVDIATAPTVTRPDPVPDAKPALVKVEPTAMYLAVEEALTTVDPSPVALAVMEAMADPAPTPVATPVAAPVPAPDADTFYVTGDRVNLRSAPHIEASVVARLDRGDTARMLFDMGDGWVQVRDVESGKQGFISADFLSARAPG